MRSWFVPVLGMVLVLWVSVNFLYATGAGGVRFARGASATSFDRQHDVEVLSLREDAGLKLAPAGPLGPATSWTLVRLEPASPPLCWLCGDRELAGTLMNEAAFRDGDWYYRAVPAEASVHGSSVFLEAERVVAVNAATGEELKVAAGAGQAEKSRLLASRGLAPDDAHRIAPADLERLRPASILQESCWTFNTAFLIALGGWGLVGLVARLRPRRSAPAVAPSRAPA